jgi:type II secretory pathway component PulC
MSAEMLREIFRCRCHGVLVNLWRKGEIMREKVGRCQFYFAADPQKSASQHQALAAQHPPKVTFSAEIAVLILAEFIRSPDSSFEQLAEKISRIKNVTVNPQQIEVLFDQHGLKKTIQTAGPMR